MKTRLLITISVLSLLFSTTYLAYGASSNEYTVGKIEWQYKCHPLIFNTATIRVIDPDVNQNDKLQDTLDVQVWSDFDLREEYRGFILTRTLQETGNSTGVFEGIIFWGNPWDDSLGHRIPIWDGNTVTAKYVDHTIPSQFTESRLEITSSIEIKDIKHAMKTKHGSTVPYVIYEPCTLELFDMQSLPTTEKVEFVFPPPLKQLQSGLTLSDVQCRDGLVFAQKGGTGIPICIKPETKKKLAERDLIELPHPYSPYPDHN